jgi:prephenate dehydrogenase
MGFERVAVIGADAISASIALALKARERPPQITGFDLEPVKAELARSRGAFDKVQRRLDRVAQDADLVIIAIPLSYVRDAFATIAPGLRPGCLVTDTTRLKAPIMAWAKELLPENVHFAGGHLIPNPARVREPVTDVGDASADLLRGALYCFTTPLGTTEAVVNTLTELAAILGAQPFFMDATEHDGMQAGVEELPSLLPVALLLATVDTPGWHEMRKFAGQRFALATEAVDEAYAEYAYLHHNRANVLLRLNGLLTELIRLRKILTKGDAEELEATLAQAVDARANWIEERNRGLWGAERIAPMGDVPTSGEQMGRLFFGERMVQRLKKGPDTSRQS